MVLPDRGPPRSHVPDESDEGRWRDHDKIKRQLSLPLHKGDDVLLEQPIRALDRTTLRIAALARPG